jgi:hypothetical protein
MKGEMRVPERGSVTVAEKEGNQLPVSLSKRVGI